MVVANVRVSRISFPLELFVACVQVVALMMMICSSGGDEDKFIIEFVFLFPVAIMKLVIDEFAIINQWLSSELKEDKRIEGQ